MGADNQKMPTVAGRIAAILAEAPEGCSTPELARQVCAHLADRQIALTTCGGELRRMERRGIVRRVGTTPGGWQRGMAVIWAILPPDERARIASAPVRQGIPPDLTRAGLLDWAQGELHRTRAVLYWQFRRQAALAKLIEGVTELSQCEADIAAMTAPEDTDEQ